MGTLAVAVIVLASVEVGYFVKTFIWSVGSRIFRKRIHPLQQSTTYGLVTTRDIDFLLTHLNNSRYLRSMDFGRVDHFSRCRLFGALKKHKSSAVVASSVIRYRKPVYILMPYALDTGIVHWDDRSLYYRQDIRTMHDGFIRATAYLKVTVIGCTPEQALDACVAGYKGKLENLVFENSGVEDRDGAIPISLREHESSNASHSVAFSTSHVKALDLLKSPHNISFYRQPVPADVMSFMEYNKLSSIRLKASAIVDSATNEAVRRVKDQDLKCN